MLPRRQRCLLPPAAACTWACTAAAPAPPAGPQCNGGTKMPSGGGARCPAEAPAALMTGTPCLLKCIDCRAPDCTAVPPVCAGTSWWSLVPPAATSPCAAARCCRAATWVSLGRRLRWCPTAGRRATRRSSIWHVPGTTPQPPPVLPPRCLQEYRTSRQAGRVRARERGLPARGNLLVGTCLPACLPVQPTKSNRLCPAAGPQHAADAGAVHAARGHVSDGEW